MSAAKRLEDGRDCLKCGGNGEVEGPYDDNGVPAYAAPCDARNRTDRLKRHARSVRNWSEWRSDMFRMLDEARGASA